MTLNVQFSWQDYITDGVQTVFPYPFYVKEKQDVAAYWEAVGTPPWHPGQAVTPPLPSAFYTITGLGQPTGGTLVTQTPLPAGRLVLRRGTPQNQLTDYLEGDAFPAASHETALDRLTLLVQDHEEVLSRASRLRVETGTPHRGLQLPDPQPNTVLGWDSQAAQWTLYPSGITAIPVDPVSGIGWGKNTMQVTPIAGAAQASGLVFPSGVLALAVTVWVHTTLGLTQGLEAVGLGTLGLPDCWGHLPALTSGTETTAGLFQSYGGQPQPSSGVVTLTAYGGRFDGAGVVYVTGHFVTFGAAKTLGYTFHPGAPDDSQPLPPVNVPLASELEAGIAEVATTAETTTGTDDTRLVTPLKLKQQLDPLRAVDTTLQADVDALEAADTTLTTLINTRVPAGTPLSVTRYKVGGIDLETSPLSVDANSNLLLGTVTPGTSLTTGLVVKSGTAPTASHPADAVQLWVADLDGVAGQAALHVRSENGILSRIGTGLMARRYVQILATQTIAAPYVAVADESGKVFVANNTSQVQLTLPLASAGLVFEFIVNHLSGFRIRTSGTNVIRLGATVGTAGGAIEVTGSGNVGHYLTLVAINTAIWQVMSPPQSWALIA